jgi:hypothetical protein
MESVQTWRRLLQVTMESALGKVKSVHAWWGTGVQERPSSLGRDGGRGFHAAPRLLDSLGVRGRLSPSTRDPWPKCKTCVWTPLSYLFEVCMCVPVFKYLVANSQVLDQMTSAQRCQWQHISNNRKTCACPLCSSIGNQMELSQVVAAQWSS